MGIFAVVFSFIFYMSLTIVIEVGIAYLMGYRTKNFLIVVGLASVITNPVLNIVLSLNATFIGFYNDNLFILILEIIVVFVEFYILCYVFDRKYSRIKLFRLAVIINLSSYLIGYYLQEYVFVIFN